MSDDVPEDELRPTPSPGESFCRQGSHALQPCYASCQPPLQRKQSVPTAPEDVDSQGLMLQGAARPN